MSQLQPPYSSLGEIAPQFDNFVPELRKMPHNWNPQDPFVGYDWEGDSPIDSMLPQEVTRSSPNGQHTLDPVFLGTEIYNADEWGYPGTDPVSFLTDSSQSTISTGSSPPLVTSTQPTSLFSSSFTIKSSPPTASSTPPGHLNCPSCPRTFAKPHLLKYVPFPYPPHDFSPSLPLHLSYHSHKAITNTPPPSSRHTKAHTKPHPCPYCTFSSATPRDLARHIRHRHPDFIVVERFTCPVPGCGVGFVRGDYVNRHLRTVHRGWNSQRKYS